MPVVRRPVDLDSTRNGGLEYSGPKDMMAGRRL